MDKFCCRRYNSLYLMFNKEKVRQQYRSKNGMTMATGLPTAFIP